MGITTHCIAYLCWDYGIKKGNFKLLNILSYSNPIISTLLLIVFGLAHLSAILFVSVLLLFLAGLIGGIRFSYKK